MVVLEGWGHMDPADPMTPWSSGSVEGIVTRQSRHTMFSPEYKTEFNKMLTAYLESNPKAEVLLDLREVNSHDRFAASAA
jgi:hypothetical protein